MCLLLKHPDDLLAWQRKMQENFRSSILHGSSEACVLPGVHSFACNSLGVAGCGMPDAFL